MNALIFLYFFLLPADQLSVVLGGLTFRINDFLALFLVVCLLLKRPLLTFDRPFFLGIAALFGAALLSFLLSPYKVRTFFFLGWLAFTLLAYCILPYLLASLPSTRRLYLASPFAVGAYALFQLLLSLFGIHDPFVTQWLTGSIARPHAFSYEPSFYALYLTPFVAIWTLAYLRGEATWKPLATLLLFFFLSTTTTALLAFTLLIPLIFFTYPTLRRPLGTLLLKCSLPCATLCLLFQKTIFKSFNFTHGSFWERWVGITNAWKIFLDHPLFGIGLGGIPSYLYDAWQTGDARFTFLHQTTLLQEFAHPLKLFEPSNVLTELLASLGLLGFTACAFLLATFFIRARKHPLVLHSKSSETQICRNWAAGGSAEIDAGCVQPVRSSAKPSRSRSVKLGQNFCCGELALSVALMLLILQINQGLLRPYVWVHFALSFALSNAATKDSGEWVAA